MIGGGVFVFSLTLGIVGPIVGTSPAVDATQNPLRCVGSSWTSPPATGWNRISPTRHRLNPEPAPLDGVEANLRVAARLEEHATTGDGLEECSFALDGCEPVSPRRDGLELDEVACDGGTLT